MPIAARTATGTTAGNSNTATTSLTIGTPAGIADGDLMLVLMSVADPNGSSPVTITPPSGFTALPMATDPPDGFGGVSGQMFYKTWTTGSPTSYTFGMSAGRQCALTMMAYSGCDRVSPVQTHAERSETGSASPTHVSPSITPTSAVCWAVTAICDRTSGYSHTASGTERADFTAGGSSPTANLALYDTAAAVPASAVSNTFTSSGSSSCAVMMTVAIQPILGAQKSVAGTIPLAGSLPWTARKKPSGSLTAAGQARKGGLAKALSGTVTAVGVELGRLGRALYGLVVPAGVTQRGYPRSVSGSVVAAATLSRRLMGRFPVGAVTAVGSLRRGFARTVTATVTGQAPSPKRFTAKRQSSVSSPLGIAGRVAIRFRTYTGQLTATGLTLHRALGVKTGQVTGTGLMKPRTVWKVPKGAVAAVGVSVHVAFQRVFGRAGTATSTLTAAAETDTLIYQRQRAVITVSAVDAAAAVTSWREV